MSPLMPRSLRLALIGVSACGLALTGCRSTVSTHVTPDPLEGGWNTKKLRGIPVTVMVPTHLEVRVIERRFYQPGGDFAAVPGATTRLVQQTVREKEQVFMVDAVRPAAGTLTHSAGFDNTQNPQFFSSYNSRVDDKTISTIAKLIPGLPDVFANLKKARAVADGGVTPGDASLAMAYTDHLVAVKVFDVNDPSLTECVRQFMAEHVNCHPVCSTMGCAPVVK